MKEPKDPNHSRPPRQRLILTKFRTQLPAPAKDASPKKPHTASDAKAIGNK
jgi:hypothetical protein